MSRKKICGPKNLKKYGGLVLSDVSDQKRPSWRHGWTPTGYVRSSRKKNHVIFGLFGLKCPVFAHAVFAPKTPKISEFSFQKQHHGPLGPTQVELRAYFGQRDPIGPDNCLLGAFLRPRVGTEPISAKMTYFANFYQI